MGNDSPRFQSDDLFGIEPALSWSNHDVSLDPSGNGELRMTPLVVGANFHVLRTDKVDLYVGPQLAYVLYGETEFDTAPDIKNKNDLTFAAILGVDVPLGDGKWMFAAAAQFILTEAEQDTSGGRSLDMDPVALEIGFGVRF